MIDLNTLPPRVINYLKVLKDLMIFEDTHYYDYEMLEDALDKSRGSLYKSDIDFINNNKEELLRQIRKEIEGEQ